MQKRNEKGQFMKEKIEKLNICKDGRYFDFSGIDNDMMVVIKTLNQLIDVVYNLEKRVKEIEYLKRTEVKPNKEKLDVREKIIVMLQNQETLYGILKDNNSDTGFVLGELQALREVLALMEDNKEELVI